MAACTLPEVAALVVVLPCIVHTIVVPSVVIILIVSPTSTQPSLTTVTVADPEAGLLAAVIQLASSLSLYVSISRPRPSSQSFITPATVK